MTIAQLLRDTRVDKDPSREIYTIDSEKAPELVEAIKSGDVTLGDGQIYILIEEGSKELVIGNSSDTYDSAFKVSGGGDGPETVTWTNVSGKPSTFTPSAHTHTIAQVSGLQGELDSKADSTDIPDVSGFATNTELTTGLELKVDKVSGKVLSDSNFTADEKSKLAGLEDVHYKGWFSSLTALEAKYPASDEGAHAFVDDVSGSILYIWDVDTNSWVARVGESTELTASQAKSLYESNPDTNAFTDDEKSKLASITAAFTTVLKTAYDNAVSWITANGANVLNHLSNTNNPHNVTAAQLGIDIDGLENIGKVWTPDYTNMETTNRITSSGGSWTSDRKGFVYVLSRGYSASIYNTVVVTINGKEVGKVWVESTSGSGSARSGSFSNIYPVKPGDVVTVTGNLETKCLFIPGIWG